MFHASLTRNFEGEMQFDTKTINNCTASLHIAAFSMHTAISSSLYDVYMHETHTLLSLETKRRAHVHRAPLATNLPIMIGLKLDLDRIFYRNRTAVLDKKKCCVKIRQ